MMVAAQPEFVEKAIAWFNANGVVLALRVVDAALILIVGAVLLWAFSVVLKKVLERTKLGKESIVARFIVSVLVKLGWACLFVMVIGKLGVDVAPLIAGLGASGLVLGFAFQESLGSLAAGIMIAFNRPFGVGDYVTIAGHEGTVKSLDMMAVVLATADNRRITIPNKQAWGAPIVNYSALDKRRIDFPVGVAYGTDLAKARALAVETVTALPGVLADPAPVAIVMSLDDSAVTISVRAWSATADYWPVRGAAVQAVCDRFQSEGIEIPFPQLDVHMKGNA